MSEPIQENPRSKSFSTWWQKNGASCRAQGGFVDTPVARQIWNAAYDHQAETIRTLTARVAALEAAAQDVLNELDIIRNQTPRVSLMVHIDTHKALRAALSAPQ